MSRETETAAYSLTPADTAYVSEIRQQLEKQVKPGMRVSKSAALRYIIDQHRSFFSDAVRSNEQDVQASTGA